MSSLPDGWCAIKVRSDTPMSDYGGTYHLCRTCAAALLSKLRKS